MFVFTLTKYQDEDCLETGKDFYYFFFINLETYLSELIKQFLLSAYWTIPYFILIFSYYIAEYTNPEIS